MPQQSLAAEVLRAEEDCRAATRVEFLGEVRSSRCLKRRRKWGLLEVLKKLIITFGRNVGVSYVKVQEAVFAEESITIVVA